MKNKPKEQTALQIAFTDKQEELLVIAKETVSAGEQFSEKFRTMVCFIRSQAMMPAEVAPVLIKAGFNPQRASEIKALAYTSDEVWAEYNTRQIGWKATLEKAREAGNATGEKRGRKRKPKDQLWVELKRAHDKAAKSSRIVQGFNCFGVSCMIVFPLNEGIKTYDAGVAGVVTVEVKRTPAK